MCVCVHNPVPKDCEGCSGGLGEDLLTLYTDDGLSP